MVMQEGESQEIVGQDILDLDQQVLDQGLTEEVAEPQYVTREQFDEMMTNHRQVVNENQSMKNHLSGLESRIDKQANAYRADMQSQAEAAARKQAAELQARILDNFDDPDQRVLWQQYFDTQNTASAPIAPSAYQEPVSEPAPQQGNDQWADVRRFVINMDIDPADTRIDYTILVNKNITAEERQEQFLKNLSSIQRAPSGAAAQPVAQAQAQTPQRSVGPSGNGFRNSEDLMDAFITGKVDATKYRELAPKFGIPL
jgi:hypothetical protein